MGQLVWALKSVCGPATPADVSAPNVLQLLREERSHHLSCILGLQVRPAQPFPLVAVAEQHVRVSTDPNSGLCPPFPGFTTEIHLLSNHITYRGMKQLSSNQRCAAAEGKMARSSASRLVGHIRTAQMMRMAFRNPQLAPASAAAGRVRCNPGM